MNNAVDNLERLLNMYSLVRELAVELETMLPQDSYADDKVAAVLKLHATANGSKLTSRHLEAVSALMQTETLKDAADHLYISHSTMRNHVRAIIQRTNLSLRGAEELRGWCIGVRDSQINHEIWSLGINKDCR